MCISGLSDLIGSKGAKFLHSLLGLCKYMKYISDVHRCGFSRFAAAQRAYQLRWVIYVNLVHPINDAENVYNIATCEDHPLTTVT
jgi:hypothetical protein